MVWYIFILGLQNRRVYIEEETVILAENVVFNPPLTYFLQARVEVKYGQLLAIPIKGNGSGDLASLTMADDLFNFHSTNNI